MPFDPNDPRLTAYALGELDAADRAAVEALLAGSDDEAANTSRRSAQTARLLTEQLHQRARPRASPPNNARRSRLGSQPAAVATTADPTPSTARPEPLARRLLGGAPMISCPDRSRRSSASLHTPLQIAGRASRPSLSEPGCSGRPSSGPRPQARVRYRAKPTR